MVVVVRGGGACVAGWGGGGGGGGAGAGAGAWELRIFCLIRLATKTPPKHGCVYGDGRGDAKH